VHGNFGGAVQQAEGGYVGWGYMPKVVEADEYASGGGYNFGADAQGYATHYTSAV